MTPRRLAILVLIVVLAAFAWWRSGRGDDKARRQPPVTTVELVKVRSGPAPVQLRALGSVVSPHSVQLRPQVNGTLAAIYFNEGDTVEAGQKLFLIDPAPFQAAVAQARAQLAADRAAAVSARAQFARMQPLVAAEYVTAQEIDDARAAADESAASAEASAAALRRAQIDLDRTLMRAPIGGRTGSVAVRAGNLVTTNDTEPLLVINVVERVQVQFALPQRDFAAIQAARAQGPLAVTVAAERGGATLARGTLVFVDNAIDAATGTVMLKAEFDNAAQALWPGAYVDVSLILRVDPAALLVPETAVQAGAEGTYVFVVDGQGKAMLRPVVVDRQVDTEMMIRKGLQRGETVVARAPPNLRPGSAVRDSAAAAARPAARAGS